MKGEMKSLSEAEAIIVGKEFDFWLNEEDDIYDKKYRHLIEGEETSESR